MACEPGAINVFSSILVLLSVIIFVNWLIVFTGDLDDASYIFGHSLDDVGLYFEGLYVAPILVTGILGNIDLTVHMSKKQTM